MLEHNRGVSTFLESTASFIAIIIPYFVDKFELS